MLRLEDFPITKRWPPKHPDRLQLYSLTTPNGVKPSIALEETGLPYEVHRVDFTKKDQRTPEYLSLNPYGKIPTIIDPNGPGRRPLPLFESGAILQYIAEKTGELLPADPTLKWQTIQWVYFQVAFIGPMFGQVGWFKKFDGKEIEDKRPLQRYAGISRDLLLLLEERLATRQWMMGDEFTIADISIIGMVRNFLDFYEAGDLVRYGELVHVPRWFADAMSRPAVQRGVNIPAAPQT